MRVTFYWCHLCLQPLVHAVLASKLSSNKVDEALLNQLDEALAMLNSKLVKKYFLVAVRIELIVLYDIPSPSIPIPSVVL